MGPALALLAPLLMGGVAPLAPLKQDLTSLELRSLTPDGRFVISREVLWEGESPVNHGQWRRWVAPAGGQEVPPHAKPIAEGRWENGLLEGAWTWRYPNGALLMTGSYTAGRRTGAWQFHHPGRRLAGEGSYLHGARYGVWVDLLRDGSPDTQLAGIYSAERASWNEPPTARHRCWTRSGLRHGSFSAWRRDSGAPMLEGRYRDGLPDGWWSFWLNDGTLDPDILTGWYEQGVRTGTERRPDERDPWEAPLEELEQLEGELARLSDPRLMPRRPGEPLRRSEQLQLDRYVDEHLAEQRDRLAWMRGRLMEVFPLLLARLVALDLDDPAQVSRGAELTGLLEELCGGSGFEWRAATGAEDQAVNRLARARWLTWWDLVLDDPSWWERLESNELPAGQPLLDWELLTRAVPGVRREPAPSILERSNAGATYAALPYIDKDSRGGNALGWALGWLLAHQDEAGSWTSAGFAERCGSEVAAPCGGLGQRWNTIGVTGLALLALMDGGRTAGQAEIEQAVERGLDWLVWQQIPTREDHPPGLIGPNVGWATLYNHGIATLAICEGYRFTRHEELLVPIQRAVALIEGARAPDAAWKYEIISDGKSDTSVTGWMIRALVSAAALGLEVDPAALAGARSWLDEATHRGTGRVGYDKPGTPSSRVPEVNDHYPHDKTETMTAVGLQSRYLLGQDPRQDDIMVKHADLLLRALPEWDAQGRTNDMYYWHFGTDAMYHLGSYNRRYWDAWSLALDKALIDSQRRGDHTAGSWDPVGPWGYAGGRVYATAMGALSIGLALRARESSRAKKR